MKTTGKKKLAEAAEASGIPVIYLKKGDRIIDGEVCITVLHPPPHEIPEDENSGSLTLRIDFKRFTAVLREIFAGKRRNRWQKEMFPVSF